MLQQAVAVHSALVGISIMHAKDWKNINNLRDCMFQFTFIRAV